MDDDTDFVTIPREDYEELKADSRKLYHLTVGGVDNWEGYDFSMQEYYEENEDG